MSNKKLQLIPRGLAPRSFIFQDQIHYENCARELYTKFEIRLDPNWKTAGWVNGSGTSITQTTNANLKVLRTYTNGTAGCILYYNNSPYMAFACSGEVSWSRGVNLLTAHNIDLMDGAWHKIAVWLKLQDTAGVGFGAVKIWVDDVMTHNYADLPLAATDDAFEYSYFLNNFSAYYPTSHLAMALDDLEVWDGLPSDTTTPPPTCTNFTYSAFGTCQSDGIQSRTITSSTPTGCVGGSPVLTQSCTSVTTYNLTNFLQLTADWLKTISSPADVNADGKVDSRDLGIMMSNWN